MTAELTALSPKTALKKYFGYDAFRPQQAEIIEHVLQNRDSLVLMPTGGGKSVCFQIPAIIRDGCCVVVSPLISLMKDQVDALLGNGVAAAFLNSSQSADNTRDIEDRLFSGRLKLLYVSPEKLLSNGFLGMMKAARVSLFAIDEAHCISAWGHDFRPEYTQLRTIKDQFPTTPIIALTATADKITRRDIVAQLNLTEPEVFLASFDRPNLSLTVKPGLKRFEQIQDFLKKRKGQSGIIYCLSRKTCEDLADKLQKQGEKAMFYHAGMPPEARSKVQEDFINDRIPIITATVAFGMGIDKSNVRWVIHYNLPKNIESYYQEIGRAGRDGAKADTLLFSSFGDVAQMREMLSKDAPSSQVVEMSLAKLERMFEYAEAKICRRRILLAYFSENFDENCGNCDICRNPPIYMDATVLAQKALSAIGRIENLGQKIGMTLLIDVLRGSHRKEIQVAGFDKIKTFGAGRDYAAWEWMAFLGQFIQIGLLEIAYDQGSILRVTEAGRAVLFDGKTVEIVRPQTKAERDAEKETEKLVARHQSVGRVFQPGSFRQDLFDRLRALRRSLAVEKSVPPYILFSDASLMDMASKMPLDDAAMLSVSGVGEHKLREYGEPFLFEIEAYLNEKRAEGEQIDGLRGSTSFVRKGTFSEKTSEKNGAEAVKKISTYDQTWQLFQSGKSIPEIAAERGISPTTIVSHLAALYERGEKVPIERWARPEEVDVIVGSLGLFEEPLQLSHIFEHFGGRYSYEQIRLSIAHSRRREKAN